VLQQHQQKLIKTQTKVCESGARVEQKLGLREQGLEDTSSSALNPNPELQLVGWCVQCISKQCLPLLAGDLPPDASAAAVAGVQGLIQAWEAWAVAISAVINTAAAAGGGGGEGAIHDQQQQQQQMGKEGDAVQDISQVQPNAAAAVAPSTGAISSSGSSSSSSGDAAAQAVASAWVVMPAICCCIAELVAKCSSRDLSSMALESFAAIATAADSIQTTTLSSSSSSAAAAAETAGGVAEEVCKTLGAKGFVGSMRVCMAAAVTVGLRVDLQQGESMGVVLQGLAKLSCSTNNVVLHPLAARTAAVAMAAVANKWQQQQQVVAAAPAGPAVVLLLEGFCSRAWHYLLGVLAVADKKKPSSSSSSSGGMDVDEPGQVQQQHHHHQQQQKGKVEGLVEAIQQYSLGLSWLSRGLAMQRSNAWQGTAALLLRVMSTISSSTISSSSSSSREKFFAELLSAGAAGGFFYTLVSDHAELAGLGLKPSLHAVTKPLWQQKAVTLALQQLQQALVSDGVKPETKATAATAGGAAAGDGGGGVLSGGGLGSGSGVTSGVAGGLGGFWPAHVAVAGLLAAVPPGVWRAVAAEAVPLLVRSVKVVAGLLGGDSSGTSSSSRGKGSSSRGSSSGGGGGYGITAAAAAGAVTGGSGSFATMKLMAAAKTTAGAGVGGSGVQHLHQGSVIDTVAVQLQLVLQRQLQVLMHGCLIQLSNVLMEPELRKLLEEHVGEMLEGLMLLVGCLRDNHYHKQQQQQQQGELQPTTPGEAIAGGLRQGLGAGQGFVIGEEVGGVSAADVREVALLCLSGAMGIPYHLLHPYRKRVVQVVTAALDDDRRAVRRAAVKCRRVWSVK
jgi:hypothetical protein